LVHVGFGVSDLQVALAFFKDVLGLHVEASETIASQRVRATFINTNPVQARVDATGEARGPAADLARALAAQLGVPATVKPAQGVPGVIETVRKGEADIGFIAFDPSRTEHVDFSQVYLLAHNTVIVPQGSALRSVNDLDKPGVRIGVGQGDSGDLYLTRTLKSATLVRFPNSDSASGRLK